MFPVINQGSGFLILLIQLSLRCHFFNMTQDGLQPHKNRRRKSPDNSLHPSLPHTSHCEELSHMATSHCKGDPEM